METPLVSLILLAYKQEQYIREAVESALAQSYQPLEIILSDDRSPDRTFEIMQEVVQAYDGPHRVTLNRCEENQGLARHVNQVVQMCSGELIVVAFGDDISLPHRVATLTAAWIEAGKKSGSIYSGYLAIDQNGNEGDVRSPRFETSDASYMVNNPESIWNEGVYGCTHAWTRDVFEVFGGLMPNVIYGDRVIPFRSALLGNVSFVNQPLIKYRRLPDSLCRSDKGTQKKQAANFSAYYRKREIALINNQKDLETALEKHLVDKKEFSVVHEALEKEIRRSKIYQDLLENDFVTRMGIAIKNGRDFSLTQRLKFFVVAIAPWIHRLRTTRLMTKARKLLAQ